MENIGVPSQSQLLADGLYGLRQKLENETSTATKLREAYDFESSRVPSDDVKLVAAKLRFDAACAGVEKVKAEITDKERLFDEAEGREAEENRRQQAQEDFEHAENRVVESRAELERLRAELSAFSEKIRVAEWHFQEALAAYCKAKQTLLPAR